MNNGHILLAIGLFLAIIGFVFSYEYPTSMKGALASNIALGSLIIIVVGTIVVYRSSAR